MTSARDKPVSFAARFISLKSSAGTFIVTGTDLLSSIF